MVHWTGDLTRPKPGLGATHHCTQQAVIATARPSSPLGLGEGRDLLWGVLTSARLPGQPAAGTTVLLTVPQVDDHLEGRCSLLGN